MFNFNDASRYIGFDGMRHPEVGQRIVYPYVGDQSHGNQAVAYDPIGERTSSLHQRLVVITKDFCVQGYALDTVVP